MPQQLREKDSASTAFVKPEVVQALAEAGDITLADLAIRDVIAKPPGLFARAMTIAMRRLYQVIDREFIDPAQQRADLLTALEAKQQADLAIIEAARLAKSELAQAENNLAETRRAIATETAAAEIARFQAQTELNQLKSDAEVMSLFTQIAQDPNLKRRFAEGTVADILREAIEAGTTAAALEAQVEQLTAEYNRLLGDEKLTAARQVAAESAQAINARIQAAHAAAKDTDIPQLAASIYDNIANNRYDDEQKKQLVDMGGTADAQAEQLRSVLSVLITTDAQTKSFSDQKYKLFVDMGVSLDYYPPDQPEKSLVAQNIAPVLAKYIDPLSPSVRHAISSLCKIQNADDLADKVSAAVAFIEAGAIITADEFKTLLTPGEMHGNARPAAIGMVALKQQQIEGLNRDILTQALLLGCAPRQDFSHFFGDWARDGYIPPAQLILAIAKHPDTQVDALGKDGKTALEMLAMNRFKDAKFDDYPRHFKLLTQIVDALLERTQLPQQHLVEDCKHAGLKEYLAQHPKISLSNNTLGRLAQVVGAAPAP